MTGSVIAIISMDKIPRVNFFRHKIKISVFFSENLYIMQKKIQKVHDVK